MTGIRCPECNEPILASDDVRLRAVLLAPGITSHRPAHVECLVRPVMSHFLRQCACYAPDRSVREEARATMAALRKLSVRQWN